jgi:hypothetical protein
VTDATRDDIGKASIILVILGLVFAGAGETRSAIVIEAIGVLAGLVATWHSPIEPWH